MKHEALANVAHYRAGSTYDFGPDGPPAPLVQYFREEGSSLYAPDPANDPELPLDYGRE